MEHDPQLCAGVYLAMQGKSGWRRQTINVSEGGTVFYPLSYSGSAHGMAFISNCNSSVSVFTGHRSVLVML